MLWRAWRCGQIGEQVKRAFEDFDVKRQEAQIESVEDYYCVEFKWMVTFAFAHCTRLDTGVISWFY